MSDWLENMQVVHPITYQVIGEILLPQHVLERAQQKGHIKLTPINGAGNFPPVYTFLWRKMKGGRPMLQAPEGFEKTPVHLLPQRFTPL